MSLNSLSRASSQRQALTLLKLNISYKGKQVGLCKAGAWLMGSVPPCQTRAFTYNLVLDLKKFVLDKRNEAIGHVLRDSPSVRSKHVILLGINFKNTS